MWQELSDWEKRNNALVYGVLDCQSVREDLSQSPYFDPAEDERICDIDSFTDKELVMAMKSAYDNVEYQDYQAMIDFIEEWLVDHYQNTRGLDKGQLWNAETKTFEIVILSDDTDISTEFLYCQGSPLVEVAATPLMKS